MMARMYAEEDEISGEPIEYEIVSNSTVPDCSEKKKKERHTQMTEARRSDEQEDKKTRESKQIIDLTWDETEDDFKRNFVKFEEQVKAETREMEDQTDNDSRLGIDVRELQDIRDPPDMRRPPNMRGQPQMREQSEELPSPDESPERLVIDLSEMPQRNQVESPNHAAEPPARATAPVQVSATVNNWSAASVPPSPMVRTIPRVQLVPPNEMVPAQPRAYEPYTLYHPNQGAVFWAHRTPLIEVANHPETFRPRFRPSVLGLEYCAQLTHKSIYSFLHLFAHCKVLSDMGLGGQKFQSLARKRQDQDMLYNNYYLPAVTQVADELMGTLGKFTMNILDFNYRAVLDYSAKMFLTRDNDFPLPLPANSDNMGIALGILVKFFKGRPQNFAIVYHNVALTMHRVILDKRRHDEEEQLRKQSEDQKRLQQLLQLQRQHVQQDQLLFAQTNLARNIQGIQMPPPELCVSPPVFNHAWTAEYCRREMTPERIETLKKQMALYRTLFPEKPESRKSGRPISPNGDKVQNSRSRSPNSDKIPNPRSRSPNGDKIQNPRSRSPRSPKGNKIAKMRQVRKKKFTQTQNHAAQPTVFTPGVACSYIPSSSNGTTFTKVTVLPAPLTPSSEKPADASPSVTPTTQRPETSSPSTTTSPSSLDLPSLEFPIPSDMTTVITTTETTAAEMCSGVVETDVQEERNAVAEPIDHELFECKAKQLPDEEEELIRAVRSLSTGSNGSGWGSPSHQKSEAKREYRGEYRGEYDCLCGQPAEYVCTCRQAAYCGRQCQINDWPDHKNLCGKNLMHSP